MSDGPGRNQILDISDVLVRNATYLYPTHAERNWRISQLRQCSLATTRNQGDIDGMCHQLSDSL